MAYNSQWTGPQIDNAIGRVRDSAEVWDSKQDKLKGTVKQILGFDVLGNPVPKALDDFGIPTSEGMEHYADTVANNALQSAKKYTDNSISNSSTELKQYIDNAIDGIELPEGTGLPAGGSPGQILAKKTSSDGDAEWIDPPSGGGGGSGLPSSAIQQMIDDSIDKLTATDIEFNSSEGSNLVSVNAGDAINELDSIVSGAKESIVNIQETVKTLNETIETLKGNVESTNTTVSTVTETIETVKATVETLGITVNGIDADLDNFSSDLDKFQTELENVKQTIKEIQESTSPSGKQYTLKLLSTGWVNYEQSFEIDGISDDESKQLIQPVPSQNDFQVYIDCELKAKQSLNTITFVCEEEPDKDITVYIAVQELQPAV